MSDIHFEQPANRDINRYDIDTEQVRDLTRTLLAEQPPVVDENFICYQLDGASTLSDIGRYVERVVFEDAFGNDASEMKEEYGAYEDDSVFYVTIDQAAAMPVGVLRVIKQGEAGLKTLNDLLEMMPELTLDMIYERHAIAQDEEVWDVGTVAVLPEYRDKSGKGSAASVQLFRALYLDAMNHDVKHMVSVIDRKAHQKLTGFLGVPFVPLADLKPFSYLGSKKSRAVYGRVDSFYEKMSARPKGPIGRVQRHLAHAAWEKLVMGTRDHTIMGPK